MTLYANLCLLQYRVRLVWQLGNSIFPHFPRSPIFIHSTQDISQGSEAFENNLSNSEGRHKSMISLPSFLFQKGLKKALPRQRVSCFLTQALYLSFLLQRNKPGTYLVKMSRRCLFQTHLLTGPSDTIRIRTISRVKPSYLTTSHSWPLHRQYSSFNAVARVWGKHQPLRTYNNADKPGVSSSFSLPLSFLVSIKGNSSKSIQTRTMATSTSQNEFLCIVPDKPGALAKRLEVRPYVTAHLVLILWLLFLHLSAFFRNFVSFFYLSTAKVLHTPNNILI
jgi:hypothetical protein